MLPFVLLGVYDCLWTWVLLLLHKSFSWLTILCYLGAAFGPRIPPIFGWQTTKFSRIDQQWTLRLHAKYLMDKLSSFWIMRPWTFGKHKCLKLLLGFSANKFIARNNTLSISLFIFLNQRGGLIQNFSFKS